MITISIPAAIRSRLSAQHPLEEAPAAHNTESDIPASAARATVVVGAIRWRQVKCNHRHGGWWGAQEAPQLAYRTPRGDVGPLRSRPVLPGSTLLCNLDCAAGWSSGMGSAKTGGGLKLSQSMATTSPMRPSWGVCGYRLFRRSEVVGCPGKRW
ncbi:hypothetical protein GSI_12743 [Ganoderma sinense ZZ0214-1]|uniref:Uncharacterized protein n=1 Tax=Ganoderma sinense ZZ0214-1 TaxID=1077348 RepID=A0A2G8RTK9_9APHY|nr:hypothetical protein GSI_12743 [Ganoderma sinense ZZ0214-1]